MKHEDIVLGAEMIGPFIESEIISLEQGCVMLAEHSHGGLTVVGAATLLMDWRSVRQKYEDLG